MIEVKGVKEKPNEKDVFRILVDRVWPRGLSKAKAKVDLWMKEVAPSNGLKKWFNSDPEKWPEFKEKYATELRNKQALINTIKALERVKGKVTFVSSTQDEDYNNAKALFEIIQNK